MFCRLCLRNRGGIIIQSNIEKNENEKKARPSGKIDGVFLILTLLLLAAGLICLFSASYAEAYYKQDGKSTYFVLRQGGFALFGLVAMYGASRIDYHRWVKAAIPMLVLSLLLLASVKVVPSMWQTINGATRWIKIKSVTFQPSEVVKFAVIVSFSTLVVVLGPKRMKRFKTGILPFMIIIGLIGALLLLEPHMSATIIIALIGIAIIFVGGASIRHLLLLGGAGVVGVIGVVALKGAYIKARIRVWLDPFSDPLGNGWQGSQSQIAVGSGGFWGLGLGQSRQKHLYLPEPANDFIFAVICEELGFVFATAIIVAFAALIWRGFYIAKKANDRFGTLLAVGLTTQIAVQVIINLFVVTGLMPITGASLPFFSYGGTSLLMLLAQVGVLLNISRSIPVVKEDK